MRGGGVGEQRFFCYASSKHTFLFSFSPPPLACGSTYLQAMTLTRNPTILDHPRPSTWPRSQRSSTTSPSPSPAQQVPVRRFLGLAPFSLLPSAALCCLHSCCYCFIEQGRAKRGVVSCVCSRRGRSRREGGLNARRDCGNFSIVACLIIAIVGFFTSRRARARGRE